MLVQDFKYKYKYARALFTTNTMTGILKIIFKHAD